MVRRKIMDQYRQDCDALNTELNYQTEKQKNELEAKLAARRARRVKDNQRRMEEEAAQNFLQQQVIKRINVTISSWQNLSKPHLYCFIIFFSV